MGSKGTRQVEVEKNGSVTSGKSIITNEDDSQHVTTFIKDEETGLGLRVSYDVSSEGDFSSTHFSNQSNVPTDESLSASEIEEEGES